MKISTFSGRSSIVRCTMALVTGGLAMILATPFAHAKSGTGLGGSGVVYSVPRQIVQGNMPLSTSYTLQITSPANLPVGGTSLVTLNTSLLASPAGITSGQALSFVTYTPLQAGQPDGSVATFPASSQVASPSPVLTFTAPNQTLSVTVSVNIPDGAWAGSFGYEILTVGWPAGLTIEDPGAFINVTATRVAGPNGPVISIAQPVDQTVYTFTPSNLPAQIPYTIVGSTLDGSPLIGMNGTVNGQDLGLSPMGLGTANATATGTFSVSSPGIYTIAAVDANAVGLASTSVQITVQVLAGPPSVVINTPAPGSTYVLSGSEVDVPFTFTGTSQYGGVVQLSATLDGVPVTITPNGYGNLVATASGTLALTSMGSHALAVTCVDRYGTATTSESVVVTGGSAIKLGAAACFSILTYNKANTSDSAFQGACIGVVNGNWAQSGGQRTNTQQATTVYLSPGFTSSGPAVETVVYNGTYLNTAWTAAVNESARLAALPPTQTLGSITKNTTITQTAVGNYVYNVSSISLNHPARLVISAPAGSTVVVNVSGALTLNGATDGGWLLLAGGLTPKDVVYNFTGTGNVVHTAGGGNGSIIQGTILATKGTVQIDPGEVDGEIIAQTFSSSSGTLVNAPPCN